jgi:hypothetical protein
MPGFVRRTDRRSRGGAAAGDAFLSSEPPDRPTDELEIPPGAVEQPVRLRKKVSRKLVTAQFPGRLDWPIDSAIRGRRRSHPRPSEPVAVRCERLFRGTCDHGNTGS